MLTGELHRFMPDKDAVCDGIEEFYRRTRRRVRTERKAVSKHIGGKLTDSTYGEPNAMGKRESLLQKGVISIDKEVAENFDLVMKHPGTFTALAAPTQASLPVLRHSAQSSLGPSFAFEYREAAGQTDRWQDRAARVQKPIFAKE
jgi:hypothetical protein